MSNESRPLKPRSLERVIPILHRGLDAVERASAAIAEGKIDDATFWNTWNHWDAIGTRAMSLLSDDDKGVAVRSRNQIRLTGFPQTPRPEA